MKISLYLFIAAVALFSSCQKKPVCPNSMKLTVTTLTPTVGDDIVITAPEENDGDMFQWSGPGVSPTSQSNTLKIYDIKLSQSGVYYCSKSNMDCGYPLIDSVFIDVKLQQEIPPCTPVNNTVNCSNIPGPTFTSVIKSYDPAYNTISLYAGGTIGYPGFTLLFNSYNGNNEPKDGTYITTDRQAFTMQDEPNIISISFVYASNYYHCRLDKKVYVTHVNGKLQVTFCNLEFASSQVTPTTTCSGKITQL